MELVPLTSATLWYLANDSVAPGAEERPRLLNVLDTHLGVAGQFLVPLTYREMLLDRDRLVDLARDAIDAAARLGASSVSLAGMLAAALRYGTRLPDPPVPVTTGHASTALSVLRAVEQVLRVCDRSWSDEHVAVVGVGSVGAASVRATLHALGVPRRLTLVDLPGSADRIAALVGSLRSRHPGLEVGFSSMGEADVPLTEASLVIGASGVPDVLRVAQLPPGAMIVDDSVPNCFDVAEARRRAASTGDLVFTNGGYLSLREPYDVVPVRYDVDGTPRLARVERVRTTQIASCIAAPLLMAHDEDLPATTGPGVAPEIVAAFGAAAERHGVVAGPLLCKGRAPEPDYLEAFASRFGRSR